MDRSGRSLIPPVILVLAALAAGCGSDDDSGCVFTDVGEVCADTDVSITFSGRGLQPESDVSIDNPEVGPMVFAVGADGQFGSGDRGEVGVLSFVADTEFAFTVKAVDADGEELEGVIVVRS
jgi:hypothetical protein